jgi:hypothetical protein
MLIIHKSSFILQSWFHNIFCELKQNLFINLLYFHMVKPKNLHVHLGFPFPLLVITKINL